MIQQHYIDDSILEYAKKLKLTKDSSNLMVAINLAQTYLWQGNDKDCEKILISYDWNAYAPLFQLCVMALKNDYEKFKELLPDVVAQKAITMDELCNWPVFRLMQSNEDFSSLLERVFGEKIESLPDYYKPMFFNPRPEKTFEFLTESLGKEKQQEEIEVEAHTNDKEGKD